jgi:hypothetical protein
MTSAEKWAALWEEIKDDTREGQALKIRDALHKQVSSSIEDRSTRIEYSTGFIRWGRLHSIYLISEEFRQLMIEQEVYNDTSI